MTINKRIKEIRKESGKNQVEFAESIGLKQGSLSDIEREKTSGVSNSVLKMIETAYSVNIDWLLTGNGEKYIKSKFTSDAKLIEIENFMHVPLVPVRASAGYLNGYGDPEYVNTLPTIPVIVDKNYKGKYMTFEVEGDSMDDGTRNAICDKDVVLGREVKREYWKCKLHIKDWYFIIVHKTEGITIKQITEHDVEKCTIKCHPTNPFYNDFVLNLDDVLELYNVIKIVDRSTRI